MSKLESIETKINFLKYKFYSCSPKNLGEFMPF